MFTAAKKAELLRNILGSDPVVCDSSCQLYAAHLLITYQFLQNLPAFTESPALIEATYFIALSDMLTVYKGHYKHVPSEALMQLDESIRPTQNLTSFTQKDIFFAQARRNIATRTINRLKEDMMPNVEAILNSRYLDEPQNLYLKLSKVEIPILPCFMGTQMMLNILRRDASLLVVHIDRLKTTQNGAFQESLWL